MKRATEPRRRATSTAYRAPGSDGRCSPTPSAGSPGAPHLGDEIVATTSCVEVVRRPRAPANVLFVDQWGVWISGVAPVPDADGRVVAVVSADIPATEGTPRSRACGATSPRPSPPCCTTPRCSPDAPRSRRSPTASPASTTTATSTSASARRSSAARTRARAWRCCSATSTTSAPSTSCTGTRRATRRCARSPACSRARYGTSTSRRATAARSSPPSSSTPPRRARSRSPSACAPASLATQSGGGGDTLSVSIGVATCPHDATFKDELVDKADWAMYLAKRRGRNKVMTFSAEHGGETPEQAAVVRPDHVAAMGELVAAREASDSGSARRSPRSLSASAATTGVTDKDIQRRRHRGRGRRRRRHSGRAGSSTSRRPTRRS